MLARTAVLALALLGCFATSRAQDGIVTQIISSINTLTAKSQALQAPAQDISPVNGVLIVVGQGPFPRIISGFNDIAQTATAFSEEVTGYTTIIPDPRNVASIIGYGGPFSTFVRVHQELLNILIGKAGLFSAAPFIGAPVVDSLRSVQGAIVDLKNSLTDYFSKSFGAEESLANLAEETRALESTLAAAINAYQGLSIGTGRKLLHDHAGVAAA